MTPKTSALSSRVPGGRRISQQSREERWSFLDALSHSIFTRLGEETMNINAVIRELKSHYDGWLLIEQDTTNVDATSTAREKAVLFGKCSEDRKRIAGRP
jgi:sugar phosphate isomerase/epimerase